jgi:NAD(P)-dependent dehydrogenase (short-subunit alcohol dehydrogenase family)
MTRPAPPSRSAPGSAVADFAGRVALVTGGSDGLGRHLVTSLVALGADVFFCASTQAKGSALAKRLGPRAHFIRTDLRNPAAARSFVKRAAAFKGQIDFLVNNAAIDPRITFERASVREFDELIAVNLRPLFVVSQAALPALRRGKGRAIVNVATTNFLLGLSPFTLYNASKAGIVGFTRSLARELGPQGIRANTVSPGWIMTAKQLRKHVKPRDRVELLKAQALKFLLSEKHVTPLTLFLLSSSAAGITGQNVIVDGGKFMQ